MKQNMRKKALFPAVAMALASVIALSGVTYAWFTTGNTAQVTGMDVNVQTANGISISLDAASWKSNISASDIIADIEKGSSSAYNNSSVKANQYPEGEIAPVSSAGTVVNGKMQMYLGGYNEDGSLYSTTQTDVNDKVGNYIAFDLFVRNGSEQKLMLGLDSKVKTTDKFSGNTDAGTEKAVRVAFLNLGCSANADAARGLTGTDVTPLIWEPNSDSHVPGAGLTGDDANSKLKYQGFDSASKDGNGDSQEIALKDVTTFDKTGETLCDLGVGINKIRVYIWLEGQDVDCLNEISFGDFTTNLAFEVEGKTDAEPSNP